MTSSPILQPRLWRALLFTACVCVLLIVLIAGLWPFHAPRNNVSWVYGGNGLVFGGRGIALTQSALTDQTPSDEAWTFVISLQPRWTDQDGTVFSSYSSTERTAQFAVRQYLGGVQIGSRTRDVIAQKSGIYVPGVFQPGRPTLLTITSGRDGASVYRNGTAIRKNAKLKIDRSRLLGRLIIGNAPGTGDYWRGTVGGIAIYRHEFSALEVQQHFTAWSNGDLMAESPDTIAIYRFDEGQGSVAHDGVAGGPDVVIPTRLRVVDKVFLERPWDEFRFRRSYFNDAAVNILGLIPLGLFFNAYLCAVRRVGPATRITIIIGFCISFSIEALQGLLPTRDSSMTDIINNTIGTAIGAGLYVWSTKQNCFAKFFRLAAGRN